jgi:hypothetical protein
LKLFCVSSLVWLSSILNQTPVVIAFCLSFLGSLKCASLLWKVSWTSWTPMGCFKASMKETTRPPLSDSPSVPRFSLYSYEYRKFVPSLPYLLLKSKGHKVERSYVVLTCLQVKKSHHRLFSSPSFLLTMVSTLKLFFLTNLTCNLFFL